MDTIVRKINALRNFKLKLSLRLQLKSGCRIAEIADLEKNNIAFRDDGTILLDIRNGKGGKQRFVNVLKDVYLYENLQVFLADKQDGEKIFYDCDYARTLARRYNIKTHDLRRINSVLRFKEEFKKTGKKRISKQTVKTELGHQSTTTTNIYLSHIYKW